MNNRISFDPFSNRLARDIRNGLSTAFARAIEASDAALLEDQAATWLQAELPESFCAFVRDRMQRYSRVLDRIHSARVYDPCRQALLAWNEQLYFEVHEILEAIWQPATGEFRKAVQGLILAAGIGEHLQYGHLPAAERLSNRADRLLRRHQRHLAFIENLEDLLDWLQERHAPPPILHPAEGSEL